jgi:hypothetical protein
MAEEAGVEPTEDAFAPSDGFEDRASHRARYSSAPGLAEYAAAAQQDPSGSLAAGFPHLVEILENLDRQIAPDARAIFEGCGREGAFGGAIGKLPRDLGELLQCLRQKKAVVGNPGNAAQPLGTIEQAFDRLGFKRQCGGDLAQPRRAKIRSGEQRVDALPQSLVARR